jgi:poly-gamma-glutamate synthesis protein (capsule biosynthesis protein)
LAEPGFCLRFFWIFFQDGSEPAGVGPGGVVRLLSASMDKSFFFLLAGFFLFVAVTGLACNQQVAGSDQARPVSRQQPAQRSETSMLITIFLAGDVMTGRGIDQILPHPSEPLIYEPYMKSAGGYVELAELAYGPLPKPVDFSYIWGDALEEWAHLRPDVKIINLETSVTTSNDYWPGKGINYRMHPANVATLTAAGIDACTLANNHVLDWGYAGLTETLDTLKQAQLNCAGAGQNLAEAETPAVLAVAGKGRVIVFAYGLPSSGIPVSWAASAEQPGVNLLKDLSAQTVRQIKANVKAMKQPGDIVVASLHWGGNWGYDIPSEQIVFAHKLIDEAGDEGIRDHEQFRADLALMYFVGMDPTSGRLVHLHMTPVQIRHFQVNRASKEDALWLRDLLNREGQQFGTHADMKRDHTLTLDWD